MGKFTVASIFTRITMSFSNLPKRFNPFSNHTRVVVHALLFLYCSIDFRKNELKKASAKNLAEIFKGKKTDGYYSMEKFLSTSPWIKLDKDR